jgi:hypothetical protein
MRPDHGSLWSYLRRFYGLFCAEIVTIVITEL